MAQCGNKEVSVRRHASNCHRVQHERESRSSFGSCRCMHDHLGQHGIEVDADDGTSFDTGVDPCHRRYGWLEHMQGADYRQEVIRRVFGVKSGLDRMAADR